MLSSFSQYSPLGLPPSLLGFQGVGSPMGPGFYGQGLYGQGGYGMPFGQPFQTNPLLFTQNPFAVNPYLQTAHLQSPYPHYAGTNSFAAYPGAQNPAVQIIPLLGQLAQQISVQGGVYQQIGIALHQLCQQLALQVQAAIGQGAGQGFGQGSAQGFGLTGQPFNGLGQSAWAAGQTYGNPFAGPGGFAGQSPTWAAQRPQTIQ